MDLVWADRDPPFRFISCYLYLASSFFISQLFADGPYVLLHAVASFLRVSDHTIERISHESWSLILVALTFAAGVGTSTTGAPGLKTFFSDQAVDGTIVIADERSGEMLAYDVERTETVHAGIDF